MTLIINPNNTFNHLIFLIPKMISKFYTIFKCTFWNFCEYIKTERDRKGGENEKLDKRLLISFADITIRDSFVYWPE